MKPALTRPDPPPAPTRSWWLNQDRDSFRAAVARELPRMSKCKDADSRKTQSLDALKTR